MDTTQHSAPNAPKLPDHELIRRDAAGRTYVEDLRRIQRKA